MWGSFTRDEKRFFLGLLGLLAVGAVAMPWIGPRRQSQFFRAGNTPSAGKSAEAPSVKPALSGAVAANGQIDLNTASQQALEALPGIGPAKAKAILSLRAERGAFKSIDELDDVKGIGPAMMDKLRPHVTVAGGNAPSQQPAAAGGATQFGSYPAPLPRAVAPVPGVVSAAGPSVASAAPHNAGKSSFVGPVNINNASAEVLMSLKFVGPSLAQNIINHRSQYGAFQSPEGLDAVKGIGRRVIDENRGRIVVR